jgi:hypothetical protein
MYNQAGEIAWALANTRDGRWKRWDATMPSYLDWLLTKAELPASTLATMKQVLAVDA